MPNKVTYTITTSDGKEHQVSKENVDKYGIQSYADAYKGATIRMRDAQKGDYDIPLQHFDNARKQGLHAFSLEHTPVQKQAAPKPTPTSTAKPTPSPSVNPRQSTLQGSKPLLSDSFGKGTGTDFLKSKPVGYNLSEEHRNEVLGEQAKRSATPSNPHVQRAVQLGNEAKAKRVEREQKRFGKPTIAKAFDDAVHGEKKAAKELGMPQVMQQKKDEIDYMQATGKELRNPVDAGLTYDENGDVVHSMFAPTVARDEHGNIVTNEAGEPLVGISSDEARAKAYGDSVQTGIEAQREKDKVDNLYKDAVESVNDAFDEDYKKKEAFRKEHPFLGAVSDALEGFSNRGNALQYTPEGAKPGLAALGMLSKAAIAKNNADRYGDAGTLSRLYGGIMAGLTDVDTYDFGITDTFNAANLYRAAKNYEEGKATAKDKMLLDAAAIANNVQSEASDKLGGAFGAGQNLVRTFGFMMQMTSNPASGVGKEAAASVAKTVAKRALQKFGKGAIAKAVTGLAKGATRVGMDAVEAGVVTGMYSPTKIVGDYLNRKTGDVQSDGKGGYIFQNKEYSDVKALAKAINGQYAENISEMWGEYLPGVGKVNAAIGRGMRKVGLGKVVDAFEHMSSSNWAKTWKNFQEKTKWNGMAGEYFEEVANNFYNAVTNGDMTLDTDPHTGVFNPKINRDTFYSVALMSGIMSGVNTAGYARERYKAPHEQRKADAQARSVFGERWDEYKNAIDNADEKQIGSVMEKIGNDKSLSNTQKVAALQYQYRTAVVHGVNAQDTKNKLEGQFNAMDEAYSMGYNLQDEKELNNTAILYDEAKKQATKATGWNEDTLESMIGEDGGASTLAYMKRSDEFNDGQLQAFTDYANARAAYNGIIQRVKDDIDTKVHESNLEVEQRTNLDTGAIHPATMKVDDRQVYIVNGNVVMLPDGSGVDHEHSDDFVVLRDAETGELETADPSAIFKVDAPINVQEEKEAAADNIRQTFAQQQADKIDGKLEFKQGDTYSIIDKEDGTQHSLSIIGDVIDEKTGQVNPEMVLVDIDGAQQPILLPKEQVQQQVDEARRAAVAATQVVENAPTTNTNNTYSINDEITLSDENGNAVRGSITAPENEDGKFEVYTEQPINGKKVNLFSAEELDAITKAPETVAENATVQQPQQQEETEESVEKETPKQQPTALERIPKDESGQPLYEQTEPETAWDAIVEQTEGDTSMAQTVADDMVSDLEAGVKKAEKTKAKSGGSIAEKIAAEKERAAIIEQAKATLAHWRKIAAVNRMREAAMQAEEQRKADEVARVRKEQEEKERVEQEEAERIKREALNGVPDFVEDKATDARARGYRRVNGDKVDRQEPINATKGKEVQVKFDDDNIPTGHVAIIEANQLQPSHKNGQRNPQHFIDEAQPKERKDDASVGAARKIAANIRPEEITSSVTAYTGAPTVNGRGEVIQGNNRSAALREMWDNHQEQGDKYKQYLIDNAESFGLKAEDIAAMDKPVLVNMLDVNDDEAISLGQFVASDTESGGTERIKPKNVVKKLGDKMKNFANILLRANDENISFAELVDSNGVDALKWLNANGVISPTQYKSAFDSKGNITAEAKNDIKGIMYQSIFEGGNTQLEEMFNALPAKAQKAILATAYRDYDSPQSERMIGDIQDSIMAYYALSHDSMFMNAKNHKDACIAVEAWRRQLAFDDVTGESYLPAEKYSNFALLLATMYKGDNQSLIQGTFNKTYDLIQGTQEETLFEQPDNTPRSLAQAIKETLNIEYNEQQGSNVLAGDNSASQEGRTGSNGDVTPRGRSEDIDGAEANQGGTEGDTGRSGSEQSSGGSQEEVAAENSHLTKKEAADFIAQMELGADVAQEIPLTIENWDKEFGEDGIVSTPIGDVKMGENQFAKLMRAGRNGKLGMLKPTLEYPDAIVEENSKAKEGTHTERPSSFIFIKSFRKADGTRYYYFASITVSVDGKEVVVSNQEKSRNRILRLLMEGSVIWRTPKDATTSSAEKQGLDYVHPDKAEGETKGSVITPQNTPSVGKDKQSSATKQEKSEETAKKDAVSEDLFAKAERVAEEDKAKRTRKKEEAKVDANPTEAQKEAGNYKKGHIKVDGFNVTIEQPKGSVRRGKDANGKEWETEMHNTYGYIRGTESVDGDHIDIFLSDSPTEGNVFVVDQVNKDGSFDEHKVMYGFSDMESARKAYLSNYEEGWQGLGNITEVSKEEFKKWIDSSKRKTKPFAEYTSVKTEGDVNVQHPIEDKGGKRLVSNERYEELKKRMRSKLGQLNLGVDPEMLAIGAEMAVYHIENGARAFGAYAKEMISDLGDAIRPYLKAFYNGARDLPEMTELSSEMTPYDEVSRFDVATIGNEGEQLTPSAIETAEQINNEATIEFNAKQEQNIDDNSFAYVPRVSELQHSTETLSNDTEAKRLATDTILSALNKAGIEVVRATDEQVQELFANTHATSLRTPQGTIYGWVVDGKIYLTEAGINPDTPIHEYTHLWAEAMKTKNKQGWNNIKTLLKGTSVWEEVVSDSNYSNITNNEDAVASEVLSRISGRENAARMESEAQKVIDEDKDVFEKAKSVTLLNRIKRALDMFWKWVGKELFKIKKFGSINEVTDRVLYDLMHSTKLNSNDKSLIGVHNISEQKLRKVLKQGGFANPSIAVIDTDKQVHNDYGEISLILPSRKINKSTGKNAGTFEGDAWTPMYPVVEKQISSDGRITINNDINAVPKDMQSEVRNALNRWLENGSDTDLSYLYLFQQGKAPQMIVEKPKYSNEVHKTLNDIMFGVNSVYNLSKNEIKKLVELYIQTELDGNIKEYNEAIQRKISKYEELIKRGKPNSLQYRVADSYLEDIEKYGYPLSPLINFVNDVQRDKIKQGSKNAQKTLNTASQIIKDASLEKDFKNWVEGLNNRYQTKEVIFDGFTPTGKRRYIPNTLENVSKIMKKQGRQASAGISISFSNFAAAVMKANGSLDNIRKKKSKLTNEHKDIEDFEEKWKEVYFDLAMKLQPNANMFDDYGFARLQEAANEKNPQTYIRNVYGITLSEEDVQKLQDLVEAIREERPALYFETKFERPVILNEFSKAVVPEDLSDDLKKTLRDNGVEVFTYKRGDIEERQKATQEAAYSSNDIAFQVIDSSRDSELIAINEQFNRELAGLTEENADTKIFNLGSPSSILLSAGVEDKPMKLYGNKIIKKMKKHGFALAELQDLPRAVANPIAVFNNYQREGNRTILTELRSQGKNIMVAITLGKNGVDVDFNIVSSVFGKRESNVVDWINKGYLTYINKEKALNYLYFSERGISKAADNSELSSAAKIVKDFVNPVIKDENLLRDDTDTLSDIDSEENAPFANDATRSHAFDKEVNEQFNRELAELTEENAQSKRLKLGYPSPMLSAAGVPDKPIILYGNKLLKKAKLHNFDVKELHNLPLAMQNPIAVFEGSHPNSFATLLEIKLGGHNTLASIEVNKKGEADFNFISSLFGKESKGVTKWILDGKLLSVDKEKAQSYISASALNADATYKNELSSAAKIVKDFVNPNIDEEKLREGYGSYTNSELSFINDPVAKMLGKSSRTEEDHKAFAERERQRMMSRISELADRLHLNNIEVVTDSNGLQGKKAKAKGFYSKSSGKITIVIPNHVSVEDVEKTLLHEAVTHYGLRELFGEHFETFLDNVYQNVEPEIRRIITSQAANNNWDFRTATEEYLAGLAERTDFERVHYAIWNKIKSLFLKMLHSIGFEGWSATELSDNELRYLLWRSYENMKEPGRYRSILGEAEDVAKQNELKVGNYDQQETNSSNVAESKTDTENTLYRQGSNGQSAYDIYENAVKDSGRQTMLGALARTVFSKDARTRFKNKFAESYFDYSRSIKQLQDAIEESLGVKLDSYEDVWRTLNAKGSADAQEVNLAMLRYIAPLAEHIGYMIKGKSLNGEVLTVDDVEKYMNAVHGIERNKHMQEAAFKDKLIKKLKSEGYSNDESEAIVEAELDNIRKGNGSMYMDIYDNARKDYSGLTALFVDEVEDADNVDELEAAATQYANDFGKAVGIDKTLELWDKVRALNDFSLRKSYLSGLISKAQYEGVKQMYQYYVPLRGWHEGAAGDIYEYISRGERTEMLESALKTAKGRKSRAGDILGTMAAMVNTAIVQGNRNLVAQKFLNMALNYGEKSGLLMVGKQWYEESANEELIPLFPNLHDGMTVQEQQDEIERFEKDMEEKRKAGRVRELRKGFNKEVGLRMPKWQEQEHCVRVLRNGREHQVYILGNPRAAQAFNGLLNKQAKSDILRDGWAVWMRTKATMQTSLSPEFVFSNFQRDILTAGTGTYIKFGRKAGVEFAKNLTMLNPMAGMSEGRTGGIFTLIHRYNKGTLDMSNEVERMFDEFVRNGGMTGVSVIEGKDEYQKSINKAVKRIKQGKLDMGRQAIHGLADAIEFMNSGVENSTRFAAYMVSRKTLGKSVTESVFDAKEASVNFNMKGSGAWLNLWMRRNIMYANPAIQSLRMLGTWYEASPKRFMGVLSTIIATSVTMAMLWASIGAGDGDDDNDWYKLSEWNRYNYLNVWTGNGYAHWSLPQEFRPAWALGQIVFDWQRGMVSKERAINSMMTQLNNLSPMAFFSGGMDSKDSYWKTAIRAWTPTIAADFADAYVWNENFLGQKITNQEDYNIDSPEFQRAGKNTPQWAVSLSKLWNNVTGGAENRKSYWDSPALNPSALYYLAQQQLGGFGTMVTKLSKAYEQLEDPNGALEAKNIPFVSKVWVSTEDKQSKNRVTDDKFWMIYNDWKLIDSEMKHNKSDVEKGKMNLTDLAERMNELQQNGDYKRWVRLRDYMKAYGELRKARNNGADVEEAMDRLKKDVVKEEDKTLTNK